MCELCEEFNQLDFTETTEYLGLGAIHFDDNDNQVKNHYSDSIIYTYGGNDSVNIYLFGNTYYLGDGDDYAWVSGENQHVFGEAGNDKFSARGDNHILDTGDGDDYIWLTGNNHQAFMGLGNDKIKATGQFHTINMGGDDDYAYLEGMAMRINGGIGNDKLRAYGDKMSLYGDEGNDRLLIHQGTDGELYGGDGNDKLFVYNGNHRLDGNSGSDSIFAGDGNDTAIYLYSENIDAKDQYYGGAGVDTLILKFSHEDLASIIQQSSLWSSETAWRTALNQAFYESNGIKQNLSDYGFNLSIENFEILQIDLPNQTMPLLSITDSEVIEGNNDDSTILQFSVELSHISNEDVSFYYTLSGLTASGLLDKDYQSSQGHVVIEAGQQNVLLDVTVFGDSAFEADETLQIELHQITGAEALNTHATGTIINDDVLDDSALTVPIFNSKIDADTIIYLDFDGELVTDTYWNNTRNKPVIEAKAYSTDDDYANFSTQELNNIETIWQRVAEDYAPFNVNVTTDRSLYDATDSSSSLHAMITGSKGSILNLSKAGGVALYNVLGRSDYYKPAWVFAGQWSGNEKRAGEATSHEIGHNLGLYHDGEYGGDGYYRGHDNGDTGWAPIMGIGYYKNVTQWSNGGYPGFNNHQDDLLALSNYLGYRDDDHSDEIQDASLLHLAGGLAAEGVIETNTDIDVFKIMTETELTLSIKPQAIGANLDILATLMDENGQVLQTSNPLNKLDANIQIQTTEAQTFYVSITGTGKGDDPSVSGYSDYGSLGYYSIDII